MMRLEISVLASRDLYEIHGVGLGRYGPAPADAYLAKLFSTFEHIAQWPSAARERLSVRPSIRLFRRDAHIILYRVILYRVEGETVLILRVLHHNANWLDLL